MEGILDAASDWKMAVDLPGIRECQEVVKQSGLRLDMVLSSESSRTLVIVELTVPYKSNMSESHEFKLAKYEGLASDIRRQGYKTLLFTVEWRLGQEDWLALQCIVCSNGSCCLTKPVLGT